MTNAAKSAVWRNSLGIYSAKSTLLTSYPIQVRAKGVGFVDNHAWVFAPVQLPKVMDDTAVSRSTQIHQAGSPRCVPDLSTRTFTPAGQ